MKPSLARAFYNAAGVTPRNDPQDPASTFAIERIKRPLARHIRPGTRVLDLCCGAGRYTFATAALGARAVGLDCAQVPLQYARSLAIQWHSPCHFLGAVLPALPLAADSFDLVLLPGNTIAEFSPEDMALLARESARVLAPEGLFCHDLRPDKQAPGPQTAIYSIPGKGRFQYRSYGWTAATAKAVLGASLQLVEDEVLATGRHWLAFQKRPR
ncbi:MAG: methyltransferase domain-containing protein [Candidatus Latescibacteria bacterium]|nr:methyltransferase domain-containing protein [Candidatus Latescibacterota bacterium]